ncbi:MAG TPA: hypothetical protein K8U90_08955 [Akkermansia muciniphila]|nr:hypothetical protein [Akkermansia muciniphila]
MPNFIASLKTFFMHTESLPKYPPMQKPPPAFETAQDKSENRRTLFPESWYICRECPFQQPQETFPHPAERETHALFSGHIGLKIRFIHHGRVRDSPANYNSKKE